MTSLSLVYYLVPRFILQTPCMSFKPKRLRYPFDLESFKHAIIIRVGKASKQKSNPMTTPRQPHLKEWVTGIGLYRHLTFPAKGLISDCSVRGDFIRAGSNPLWPGGSQAYWQGRGMAED